jgi:dipeptidyl aminopeptidase/acylaminoacyl peptidase
LLLFAVAAEVHIATGSARAVLLSFKPEPPSELLAHPERVNVPGLVSVAFAGADDARITGWFVPPASKNAGTVILLHGTSADRTSMLPELRILANAHLGVLAFDSPGYGTSQGKIHWSEGERDALEGAVDFLSHRRDVDPNRIGALGFSMGGYILAQVAATDRRLRALVFAATPSDAREQTAWEARRWGVLSRIPASVTLEYFSGMPVEDESAISCMPKLAPRPLLFVAGDADMTVPPPMTNALYAAARAPKALWFVPGAHHGGYTSIAPSVYGARIAAFFGAALGAPTST